MGAEAASTSQALGTSKRVFVRRLLAWGRENRRDFPWRSETDAFRVLVAEVLLQRSRGKTVARVYEALFARWPTPKALANADESEIREVIRPLGLVSRAGRLKALAKEIAVRGTVPRDPDVLQELPGVGRYAANATAVVAFGARVPVVDGVSARVYRRFFGLVDDRPPGTDGSLWKLVDEVTPQGAIREWNWAVLDLAGGVCMPRSPRCGVCPLSGRCMWAESRRSTLDRR